MNSEKPKPGFSILRVLLITAGTLLVIYFVSPPRTTGGGKSAVQNEAVNNLRQIGFALLDFESKHGSFPSSETLPLVEQESGRHPNLHGASSNAFFRQLFSTNSKAMELMFYAKTRGTRKPDNITTPGKLLSKGEVAFAYIPGLSSKSDPATPVAFAPIIPGTLRFDPKPFKGKAVILRADNSAVSVPITNDGRVLVPGRFDMLSADNPIWKGIAPVIAYPE